MLWLLCASLVGAQPEWRHNPGTGQQVAEFQPEISVYLPLAGGLPYQQARLFVDGADVSSSCIKTSLLLTYRPERPLTRGSHQVRLELGGEQQEWSFEVVGTSLISGCVFQAPPMVQPFDKIGVEVTGVPRAKVWAELVGLSERFPLKEKRRGHYQGLLKVPARAGTDNAQIEVFLQKDDQMDRQLCPGRLSMATPALAVEWLSPPNGGVVEREFRALGKAAPGSTITIKARLFFRDGVEFGKLPREATERLVADEQGRFAYSFVFPSGLPRLGVRLKAQARDAAGNTSPAIDLVLFQGRNGGLPPLRTELPTVPADDDAKPAESVPPLR